MNPIHVFEIYTSPLSLFAQNFYQDQIFKHKKGTDKNLSL